MRILGIDPGSRHTGYGVLTSSGGKLSVVCYGRLSPKPKSDLPSRLAQLLDGMGELLDEQEPTLAALETPFQGLNPRSLIALAQARGALLAEIARRGVAVREYSPTQVKTAVSGYGRASKDQVIQMVCRILGIDGKPPNSDAADALAVAICCAHRRKLEALEAGR